VYQVEDSAIEIIRGNEKKKLNLLSVCGEKMPLIDSLQFARFEKVPFLSVLR
jgi:hypothetical protein